MKTSVWITTQFEAHHRWLSAPSLVKFLQSWHRHIFHVKLCVEVSHGNREVEFLTLKTAVEKYIGTVWKGKHFESSCEQIAEDLLREFQGSCCEVSEDGENGATVFQKTLPPCMKQKSKCFVGIEAEGPHRGEMVWFIPGSVSPERLEVLIGSNILSTYSIQRLYYGAGNDRELRLDTLEWLEDFSRSHRMPVDIESNRLLISDFFRWYDVTLIAMDFNSDSHYHKKFVGNFVIWHRSDNSKVQYNTLLNDPIFDLDLDVE